MKRILAAAIAVSMVPAATPALAQQQAAATTLEQVLAHPRRAEDRVRDAYRHPAETLRFFQVEPGMKVVDYMPAGGWFTRVIVPYLGSGGTYLALNPELHPRLTGYWDMYRDTAAKFPGQARGWVGEGGARVIGANTNDIPEELNGTFDRFLIFREVHNMRTFGWMHDTMLAARRLLKPGGLLGIEQHRAKSDAPFDYVLGDHGYQREADVIALMGTFGFDLVAKSEINANPRDPANWPQGVWTLPPNYRGTPATDTARRAELDRVGESDRMTLLFRKRD